MKKSDEFQPNKSSLARAHEMRSMQCDGLTTEQIASYYRYAKFTVEAMIRWHKKPYPEMPEYDGDTDLWKSVKSLFVDKIQK